MSENKNVISQLKAENNLLKEKIEELQSSTTSLQKSEKLKNVILDISKALHKAENLYELSKIIHKNLKKIILADNFFVALYNEENDTYHFPYFVDQFDSYDNVPLKIKNSLTDYVRKTGKPLFADDTIHRDLNAQEGVEYIGAYSSQWLGAPLRVDNKTVGVVAIQDYSQNAFYTREDLEILDFIADNISFLILKKINDEKIISACNQLEKKITQRTLELEKLNQKLAIDVKKREEAEKVQNALYRISKAANSAEELYELYTILHNVIKSLMPAENFYIAQIDEDQKLISFPYYIDEYDNPPNPVPINLNTPTSYILRTSSSLVLNSETSLTFIDEHNIISRGTVPKIWVGVPLIVKNKCIGAMVVQDYHSDETYTEKDKKILTFVSNQVARTIALKKDELHINDIMSKLYQQKWALQDTTKKLEKSNKELLFSEQQLKKLLMDKDKFFSIIAHDLKSPLQSLLGNIQFLSDEFDEMEKSEGKIFINNVFKSTKTLYSLIENLLEWSRIQLGKLELNFEIFMIDDLIKKIAAQLENLTANKNINIHVVIKSKPRLIGDKNIIEIILRNILSNAIKFSYEESKIEVIYLVKNKIVKMSVRDFGTGIPEENIKKLFSDTETVTTHGTKNEKGTGLGLILCKELLEKFNGKISVTSKENEGSVFTIEFPFLESIKDLETE